MRINNTLQPYMTAQSRTQAPARKSGSNRPPCTTRSPFSDFFTREQAWSTGPQDYTITSSPYMRLSDSYDRWKAQMSGPEAPLPDSKGLTEENLAYLKENYSGELGWEERMHVLNIMQSMGILSGNQADQAYGGGMAALSYRAMQTVTQTPLQQQMDPWETRWDVLFQGTPIAGFRTLDDILAWVGKTAGKPQETNSQEAVTTQHLLDLRG